MKNSLPLHTVDSAPQASQTMLAQAQKKFGMIPNLFRVMASSPGMLQAYLTAAEAFENSSLNAVERQVVLISTSVVNGCTYCVAAHSVIADMSGVPGAVTEALRDGKEISDAKLETLQRTTKHLVEKRGWADAQIVAAFYAAGYDSQSLLDVIAGIGLKTMSNYMNHIAETPLDEAFSGRRWK